MKSFEEMSKLIKAQNYSNWFVKEAEIIAEIKKVYETIDKWKEFSETQKKNSAEYFIDAETLRAEIDKLKKEIEEQKATIERLAIDRLKAYDAHRGRLRHEPKKAKEEGRDGL